MALNGKTPDKFLDWRYQIIDRTPNASTQSTDTLTMNSTVVEANPGKDQTPQNTHASLWNSTYAQHEQIRYPNLQSQNQRPPIPRRTQEYVAPENNNNSSANMEQLFTKMANTFTDSFQRAFHTRNQRQITTYQFAGNEYEDPKLFIRSHEDYFEQNGINDDREKIQLITDQLRSNARRWYEPYKYLITSYETFVERFLEKFDSTTIVTQVMTTLYGTKQATEEPAGVFITRKSSLFQRVDPHKPETQKIHIILDQLRPELKSRLRGQKIYTIEELVNVANQVEADLEEISAATNSNYHRNNKPSTTTNPPIIANNGEENRGRQTNTKYPAQNYTQDNAHRPPTPCKYCQTEEWHYHSECLNNPFRRQENQRGAGAVARRTEAQTGTTQSARQTASRPANPSH